MQALVQRPSNSSHRAAGFQCEAAFGSITFLSHVSEIINEINKDDDEIESKQLTKFEAHNQTEHIGSFLIAKSDYRLKSVDLVEGIVPRTKIADRELSEILRIG